MHKQPGLSLVVVATTMLAFGCAGLKKPAEAHPAAAVRSDCSQLQSEVDRLKREAQTATETQSLEDRIAALQLRVLEKDAVAKSLREQISKQQADFDDAISEVVRSKAKVRSLESKAEAASDMAEGEIALKAVKSGSTSSGRQDVIAQAEQLLSMSGEEFKKQNYGGSLYLTNQAQTKIRVAEVQSLLREKLDPVAGEVRFAAPVDLKVLKASNIRKSPGLDAEVLATLQPGTSLTGLSYKGRWVRVLSGDHATGWVFQGLLAGLE